MIKQKAFTLIELIVAFTVMAVVLSAAMQSLQAFVQTSRKLSIVRETQKDLSFALLRMGDKIRNNPIDYSQYDAIPCSSHKPTATLSLASKICLENNWGFEHDGMKLLIFQGSDEAPLFPENIEVKSATFVVSPHEDPELSSSWGQSDLQRQPRVDIHLEIESTRDPEIGFIIDTSFSSRVY